MEAIARFFRRFNLLLRRRRFDRDLEEEMRLHRELQQNDLQSDGMAAEEAQHAARRQFGNDLRLKEQSHEIVGFRWESVLHDARFALRQLRKNPGFTIVTTLILTLGICASVALYAFVDAALVRPLPYQNASRLVAVTESTAECPRCNLSYEDYFDWKKNNVFQSFDVLTASGYLLSMPTGGMPVNGRRVTDGFFTTLGVKPMLGRNFYSGENSPSAPQTVILSYRAWLKYYNGQTDVIGKPITLDGNPYTVIGVLPREFHFAFGGEADLWTTIHDPNGCEKRRGCHNLIGIARLKDNVSVATALAAMKSIAAQLEKQYPGSNHGQGAIVLSLSDDILGDIRPILIILLSGAALLLLIACINVSSLLLVRAENRRREMAVRGALGASRVRLLRQFATEGITLVAAGSVLGIAAANLLMRVLLHSIPENMLGDMPYLREISFNSRIFAFAILLSALAALLFSVTPSLRLSQSNLRSELAEGSRGSAGTVWRRFGSNLVVVELAIAVVLLAAAGLLARSFYRLLHVDLNFEPDHLATFYVDAVDKIYEKDAEKMALTRQIESTLSAIPGVRSVGISIQLPLSGNGNTTWIRVFGHPWNGEHHEVNEREVNTTFFSTLKARLVSGRYFTADEDASKPHVVIVNRAFVRQYFPDESPIGKKIGDLSLSPGSLTEIVGVVDDIREGTLDQDIRPAAYYPITQRPDTYLGIVVRTAQKPEALLGPLTAAVHRIHPNLATVQENTMAGLMNDSSTAYIHRAAAWLVGGFALLALVLGVVGLYGVIAYSVSRRTREIGVRMALGAQRSTVYQLILKEAGWLIAIGIVAGLGCSIFASTFMDKLLFGVHSWDLPTLMSVAFLLAVFALLASYIPARRAASVNPVEALRAE